MRLHHSEPGEPKRNGDGALATTKRTKQENRILSTTELSEKSALAMWNDSMSFGQGKAGSTNEKMTKSNDNINDNKNKTKKNAVRIELT